MQFQEIIDRAKKVQEAFRSREQETGKTWSKENTAQGLVGDVGDLMKFVMAKQGLRHIDDVDKKLAHELSDCLWSIIVLAEQYDINLEEAFIENMNELETKIGKRTENNE